MSAPAVEPAGNVDQAAEDLKQSLLLTLRCSSLPPKPGARVARKDPFWYRSMYMLAVIAAESATQEGIREDWTARNIGCTLAITLEEQLAWLLPYRIVPRWLANPKKQELSGFLETVEPEILVLVAGMLAGGAKPPTIPSDASNLKDLHSRPSRWAMARKIRSVEHKEESFESADVAALVIGYAVRYLDMTPRGNYNLACYCSNGAKGAPPPNHSRWIEAAEKYLLDGLSGLDEGMDAWARVDDDLMELRDTDPTAFDDLVQKAGAVRTARFVGSGSTETAKPPPTAGKA